MTIETDPRTSERVAKAVQEAIDKIAASADEIEGRIRQTAADAEQNVRARADHAHRVSEDAIANIQKYVHAHPVASLGMAFAAGVVFSAILRR
jgi:ElaB/YqjD/DUF883 family membrane-anchored ribosome-binding protein